MNEVERPTPSRVGVEAFLFQSVKAGLPLEIVGVERVASSTGHRQGVSEALAESTKNVMTGRFFDPPPYIKPC
jgi:hypothetical protein